METASIAAARKNFRALINRVRAGVSILLLDDGQPVARLDPVGALSGDDDDGRLLRLVLAGIMRPARTNPPQALFRDNPPRAKNATSATALLLQERHGGR